MYKLLAILLLLISLGASAQDSTCSCAREYGFVKDYMERNYAGFADKEKPAAHRLYDYNARLFSVRASRLRSSEQCAALLQEWTARFRDHHVQIYRTKWPVASDSAALHARIAASEKIVLRPADLVRLEKAAAPEGIYYFTSDSTYKIALLRRPGPVRDFAAVILESKTPNWTPGQVKMELRRAGNNFYGISYLRDHNGTLIRFGFDSLHLANGDWTRAGVAKESTAPFRPKPVSSRRLSDSTLYLQIGSFNPGNANAIDSMIKSHSAELDALPNLVLDLRGNGGGSDFAYEPLLPYIYTGPIVETGLNVLATEENAAAWERELRDPAIPEEHKTAMRSRIAQMRSAPGTWVNVAPDDTIRFNEVRIYPRRIAVLIDRGCGSTTEQFLLAARQSRKVELMGAPSLGVLDYSNMRDTALACVPFTLSYATTRSRRLDKGEGIDNIGIRPAVILPVSEDWIEAARKRLEKGSK